MTPIRYEFIGGTSRKFWEVYPVDESDGSYVVRVRFGRIGQAGQEKVKVFSYESAAQRYRSEKIGEKYRKGYKIVAATAKPPKFVVATPKKVCLHPTLTKKNNVYECTACKSAVEFDKPQINSETPEFEQRVRRFFARAT